MSTTEKKPRAGAPDAETVAALEADYRAAQTAQRAAEQQAAALRFRRQQGEPIAPAAIAEAEQAADACRERAEGLHVQVTAAQRAHSAAALARLAPEYQQTARALAARLRDVERLNGELLALWRQVERLNDPGRPSSWPRPVGRWRVVPAGGWAPPDAPRVTTFAPPLLFLAEALERPCG